MNFDNTKLVVDPLNVSNGSYSRDLSDGSYSRYYNLRIPI